MAHPDRLAAFGRLHGLSPATADNARVLEIGCGDGYNLMALASVYPESRLEGFDLADTPIRVGEAMASAAGLDNVTLWVGDIMDAKARIVPGSFDYVIAHGVYAWVPEAVRQATLELIAHALAPHGIGYVSYNAMPGGHFRMVMRELLLFEADGITDTVEKMTKVRQVLEEIRQGANTGSATVQCLKVLAETLLEKHPSVLFHDELGEIYAPHSLTDIVANGARAGLRYLNDADFVAIHDGFAANDEQADGTAEEVDRLLVRRIQAKDNRNTCFFRHSLFVRAEAPIRRIVDGAGFDTLWVSTTYAFDEAKNAFIGPDNRTASFGNEAATTALRKLAAVRPGRLPVGEVVTHPDDRGSWMALVSAGIVELHAGPAPFVTSIGDRPEAAPFVRYQIEAGNRALPRLDHVQVNIDEAPMRALLLAADGERTIDEIAAEVGDAFPAAEVAAALNGAATIALMRR